MQAVILAGGKGTRLRPYTITLPKPLVPIDETPILDIILRQLEGRGFHRITISTGHCAELIEAYFRDGSPWNVAIRYSREDSPLSTAGALKLIEDLDESFLVMNGDILTTLDYAELFRRHRDSGVMATIATTRRQAKIDYGVVKYDETGLLFDYVEKPSYDYAVSMGVYVLERSCIELIGEGEALGMPDLFLRVIASGGKVLCHESDAFWLDIGRAEDYEIALEQFEANREKFLRRA